MNTNQAPFPTELEEIVNDLSYRPGWKFSLQETDRGQGSKGLTFEVLSKGYDTYNPDKGETYRVIHYFPVPPAAYNRQSWMRWVLDRLVEIETHEVCEFMVVGESRPFAPNHGPGWDPYQVRELNSAEHAETTYKGERVEGSQEETPQCLSCDLGVNSCTCEFHGTPEKIRQVLTEEDFG